MAPARMDPVRPARPIERDAGSVTPLVIGMVACLLLLAAGLTAATSAFLAQQRLRGICDGAAVAGANAVAGPDDAGFGGSAQDAVAAYLSVRSPGVGATVEVDGATVTLTCRTRAEVTFGALFGVGQMDQWATSSASAQL